MRSVLRRHIAIVCVLAAVLAACGDDNEGGSGDGDDNATTVTQADIDYESIGLWDDGPCDETKDPLVIGLMTVFESPVLSLEDQALALEASAEAFNARGGA